jgi:hypothetical protein
LASGRNYFLVQASVRAAAAMAQNPKILKKSIKTMKKWIKIMKKSTKLMKKIDQNNEKNRSEQ